MKYRDETWDLPEADTKEYTHCFHTYPAMMIPQIARKLLKRYGMEGSGLLDPYCGTGTSLRVFHKSLHVAVIGSRAAVKKTPLLPVWRGPVPRRFPPAQASGFPSPCVWLGRLHHPCRSGSPDPDPFGSGRARTTEVVSPTGKTLRYETPSLSMQQRRMRIYGSRLDRTRDILKRFALVRKLRKYGKCWTDYSHIGNKTIR